MPNGNDQKRETDAGAPIALGQALALLSSRMDGLVTETIEAISARGIDAYELAPLMRLRDAARALEDIAALKPATAPQPNAAPGAATNAIRDDLNGGSGRDDRQGSLDASDNLLARASAIIDVMVHGGDDPEYAAQIITRQLLGVGITLPKIGGDARAWKRMHNWRNNLIHHKKAGPAWDAYCAFKDELATIPPEERLRRAVGDKLWDRRQDELHSQRPA